MIDTITNTPKRAKKPTLSVLVPYYHDDPDDLLRALLTQVTDSHSVEILLYDDGTGDAEINAALVARAKNADSPVTLFFARDNKGRSSARNHLTDNASADWVLKYVTYTVV